MRSLFKIQMVLSFTVCLSTSLSYGEDSNTSQSWEVNVTDKGQFYLTPRGIRTVPTYGLAELYMSDNLVTGKADYEKTFELLKSAAEESYPPAALKLAQGYYKLAHKTLKKEDFKKAIKWYEKALVIGAPRGTLYKLAQIYESGVGIGKNPQRAIDLYKIAARRGHVEALDKLVQIYSEGQGVAKDPQHAFYWLKRLAKINHNAKTQSRVSQIYYNGEYGVPKSLLKAIYWDLRSRYTDRCY